MRGGAENKGALSTPTLFIGAHWSEWPPTAGSARETDPSQEVPCQGNAATDDGHTATDMAAVEERGRRAATAAAGAHVPAPVRLTLRLAAEAVVAAWTAGSDLAITAHPMKALRELPAGRVRAPTAGNSAVREPRGGTKQ